MKFISAITLVLALCLGLAAANEALRHSVHDFVEETMLAGNMGILLKGEHCIDCDEHKPEMFKHQQQQQQHGHFDEKQELSQFLERMMAAEAFELAVKPNATTTVDAIEAVAAEVKKQLKEEKDKKKKKEKVATFAGQKGLIYYSFDVNGTALVNLKHHSNQPATNATPAATEQTQKQQQPSSPIDTMLSTQLADLQSQLVVLEKITETLKKQMKTLSKKHKELKKLEKKSLKVKEKKPVVVSEEL